MGGVGLEVRVRPALCAALLLLAACQQSADAAEAALSSSGVADSLRFKDVVRKTAHAAWRKYGKMEIHAHLQRAHLLHEKMLVEGVKEGVQHVDATVEQRSKQLEEDSKLKSDIEAARDNINADVDGMTFKADEIKEHAAAIAIKAGKFLPPGVLRQANKEIVAQTELGANATALKVKDERSLIKAATYASKTSAESLEALADAADAAADARGKFEEDKINDESELSRIAAKTEAKLKKASEKERTRLDDNIELRAKQVVQVNIVMMRAKKIQAAAKVALAKAKEDASVGKVKALKVFEATKVLKVVEGRPKEDNFTNFTKDSEASDVGNNVTNVNATDNSVTHTKGTTNSTVPAPVSDEEIYKMRIAKFDNDIKRAQKDLRNSTKLLTHSRAERKGLSSALGKEKYRLKQIGILTARYRSIAVRPDNMDPMEKEQAELLKDEEYATKAQNEARQVKKTTRERIRDELAKKIDENLILSKQLEDAKAANETQFETLKTEIASLKEKNAEQAKEINGIQRQKQRDSGAEKVKIAARSVISSMQIEIKGALKAAKLKESEDEMEAKRMMAKATGALLEARAIAGTALKQESDEDKKQVAKLVENKKLEKLSFQDLASMAKKEASSFDKEASKVKRKSSDEYRREKVKDMVEKVEAKMDEASKLSTKADGGSEAAASSDAPAAGNASGVAAPVAGEEGDALGDAPDYSSHSEDDENTLVDTLVE